MSELAQAIEEMRNMRESYDRLAAGVITAPIVSELEDGKASIIAAINAMGGTATESMSMGELADAIRALILVQLGELEFDRPIASAQEAANMLQDHCTKYVDDFTEIMDTPLIVDEWQAAEEVRYKKLLDYNYTQFSSDERKSHVYALTNCHNLRKVQFDALRTIEFVDDTTSQLVNGAIRLEELNFPSLTLIKGSVSANNINIGVRVFTNLSSLTALNMPLLQIIFMSSRNRNDSFVLTGLSSLVELSLPSIEQIVVESTNQNYCEVLSGLSSLTMLYMPSLREIYSTAANYNNYTKILSGLSSLRRLSLPAIYKIITVGSPNNGVILGGLDNLEYIEIGHTSIEGGSITVNMRLNINPTNVYEDATKLAALNTSIREHWFANLRDYTGGTAHTISLPTAFVQHMEQATKDVAAAKNWTIVTF